jgi:hypothetical protein
MVAWILFDSGTGVVESPSAEPSLIYDGDCLLFSRAHWKSYKIGPRWMVAKLTRKQVSEGIKLAAIRLGLNPLNFSSHCFKMGGITDLSVQGHDLEVIRRLGDHAVGSTSTFIYQHPSGREVRPLLLASSGNGLTVKDINTVCAIQEVPLNAFPSSAFALADVEACSGNDSE